MTDGIIQEVIRKYRHYADGNEFMCRHCYDLTKIQQELIQKIKQEFQKDNDNQIIETKIIREILIGDTK
jgi:predicted transcriptional regulator